MVSALSKSVQRQVRKLDTYIEVLESLTRSDTLDAIIVEAKQLRQQSTNLSRWHHRAAKRISEQVANMADHVIVLVMEDNNTPSLANVSLLVTVEEGAA